MRQQANHTQDTGEQKKSVFDRLGRQLDTGRSANRRTPPQFGEHPMHQAMHEADFGRFGRGDPQFDMNWRFQNERRHMAFGRDRPQPPAIPFPHQFDMNMNPNRQQTQYFHHPHMPQYHANIHGPPGPPPQPTIIGPDPMSVGMHQRRQSPKYDRHGNPIRGPARMDLPSGMSPPNNFMGPPPPGPMMHSIAYDMPLSPQRMYQQNRWHDNLDIAPQIHGRLLRDDRIMDSQRFQQSQKEPMVAHEMTRSNPDGPRYSKWRERRDAITNLDRQTAQSSSKTDSLKSSLQQPESKHGGKRKNIKDDRSAANEQISNKKPNVKKETDLSSSQKGKPSNKEKTDPSEMSDGEIIDDEDSSDDSDNLKSAQPKEEKLTTEAAIATRKTPYGLVGSETQQYYEPKKRRRLHDRDEYPMDYETISDEELDDFVNDKKLGEGGKLEEHGSADGKSSSEIELLNALGLDWANLIELSKQSKKETPVSGSALRRFSVSNYIPTLGITHKLVGPEIYNLILKVCQ